MSITDYRNDRQGQSKDRVIDNASVKYRAFARVNYHGPSGERAVSQRRLTSMMVT